MPTSSRRPSGPVARVLRAAIALSLVLSSAGAAHGGKQVTTAAGSPELEQARALFDKYQGPIAAVHDGYFSTLGCVEYSFRARLRKTSNGRVSGYSPVRSVTVK